MKNNTTLQTARLRLRSFEENDLVNVFKGLSHPDVIRYYGVSYSTLEETKAQLEFFREIELNQTGKWWAICDLADHTFYGGCGLNNLNVQHRKAEIGYWLLPDCWGKGIITEALPLIIQYGFEEFSLHRIEAIVETENVHSKKIMQKTGFEYEGTMKECELKNGRFISLDIYARLNNRTA